MGIDTATKVLAPIGIVGGAGLMTVSALNLEGAFDSWSTDDERTSLAAHETGSLKSPAAREGDFDRTHSALDTVDSVRNQWRATSITTAAGAVTALGAGVGALLTKGGTSRGLGKLGLASSVLAGAAALVGWNRFTELGNRTSSMHDTFSAERDAVTARERRVRGGPVPVSTPLPRPAATDPYSIEEAAAETASLDSHTEMLSQPAFRLEMARATGEPIPERGPVDWRPVMKRLDTNRDGYLNSDERGPRFDAAIIAEMALLHDGTIRSGMTGSEFIGQLAEALQVMDASTEQVAEGSRGNAETAERMRTMMHVPRGTDGSVDWRAVAGGIYAHMP